MCRWWEVGTNQGKVMADERNVWGVKHGYLSVVEYTVSVWDLEYGQLLSRSRPMPESVDLVSNHLFAAFHLICWLKFFLYDGRFVSPSKISRISRICSRFPKRHSNGQASRQRFGLRIVRWGSIVPWVPQVEEIAFQNSLGYLVMMAQNRPQWARNENCMLKPFFYEKVCFQFTNRSELY